MARIREMHGIGKKIRSYCLLAVFIIAAALFLNRYVICRVTVDGNSMEPVLHDGERVWVDRLTYRFWEPERYDIVVFRYRYRDGRSYMKRIIGLPGETVQIADGCVYVDGERLAEAYGTEPIEKAKRAEKPVVLGKGEYFVLGDNRNNSTDSRDSDIANVSEEQITGKVIQWRER